MDKGILWIDPTTDRAGNEIPMTQVIDGYMWKISKSGKTYCAGPYKSEKEKTDQQPVPKTVNPSNSEKQKQEIAPQPVTTSTTIDKKAVNPVSMINNTPAEIKVDKLTEKIRRFSASGLSTRQISEKLEKEGVYLSHTEVAKRLQGRLLEV